MKSEGLLMFTDIKWICLGLGLFVFAFVLILIQNFWMNKPSEFETWSKIPLDSNDGELS